MANGRPRSEFRVEDEKISGFRCIHNAVLPEVFCVNAKTQERFRRCTGPGWPSVLHLMEHMKSHHTKWAHPLQCSRCQNEFSNKEELIRHEEDVDCPVRCPDCFEEFNTKKMRHVHRQESHLEEVNNSIFMELNDVMWEKIKDHLKAYEDSLRKGEGRIDPELEQWVQANSARYDVERSSKAKKLELGHWYIIFKTLASEVKIPDHPFYEYGVSHSEWAEEQMIDVRFRALESMELTPNAVYEFDSVSITSLPSMTMGSTAASEVDLDTQSTAEELKVLLFQDVDLKNLFDIAFEQLDSSRFARNFTRLLRQYSQDLSREALTAPEKQVAVFVKQKARFVSHLITESYDPANSRLMLPSEDADLERNKRLRQFVEGQLPSQIYDRENADNDGDSDTDDAENRVDVVLNDVRQFLTAGTAFVNLRTRFREFLFQPRTRIAASMDLKNKGPSGVMQESPLLIERQDSNRSEPWGLTHQKGIAIGRWILSWEPLCLFTSNCLAIYSKAEEKVLVGHQRLFYTCPCGHRSHDDYQELKDGALQNFADDLQRLGIVARLNASNQSGDRNRIMLLISNVLAALKALVPTKITFRGNSQSILPSTSPSIKSSPKAPPRCPSDQKCKYLHLCLSERESLVTKLDYMHICRHDPSEESDVVFFKKMRSRYIANRGFMRRFLWRLKQIDFVEFEAVPLQLVDHLVHPKMPPTTEHYDYKPVPINHLPPIGTKLMMHLFNGCVKLSPDDSYFFHLLPKKKDDPVEFRRQDAMGSTGYGLHFVEVVNSKLALIIFLSVDVVASLGFGILWSVWKRDLQDAWTIAAWISSVLALAVVTWQAWAT